MIEDRLFAFFFALCALMLSGVVVFCVVSLFTQPDQWLAAFAVAYFALIGVVLTSAMAITVWKESR